MALKRLSQEYARRAHEELCEAELLANSHHYLGSVSRTYYACFHAIQSLLCTIDIQTKSHKQTHIEFRKHFIKTEQFDRADSILLDQLFRMRQASDYDPFFSITADEFTDLLKAAQDFVKRATCSSAGEH